MPQGSILGPFLFLIYVNDLHKASNRLNFIHYADDTTLLTSIGANNTDTTTLNTEIDNVYKWLCANKLSVNISKTKFITFHTTRRQATPPDLKIANTTIEHTTTFNFLGIHFDQHMTWKTHINNTLIKISRVSGLLHNLKHVLPQIALRTIYNSLITPHLTYGILAWGKHLTGLFKIQKRAIRAISNSKYNAHTDPLFVRLGLLKVSDLRELSELKFYYKFVNGQTPEFFTGFVNRNNELSNNINTRHRQRLAVPLHRRDLFKSGLRYTLVQTVNSCPASILELTETHGIKTFANKVKQNMHSKYNIECNIPMCYVCN